MKIIPYSCKIHGLAIVPAKNEMILVAVMAAVSARSIWGPNDIGEILLVAAMAISGKLNPPSGPR